MEEGSVTVLVDAKEEYTKQLISILKTCIYQGIKSIYVDSKDICNQDNSPDNVLMVFQDLLSRIPKWSQDIINKEYERISNISKCDYIDDLLKVVYVSHIKILTIVHSAQKNKKISVKVPSGSHFIHLCYIECAREFWKDPYYFSDRVSKYEHQKNMRDSETMIAECIMETIRKQLPVRHILKEFLNEPDEEIEEDDDIKEPSKQKYLKKLEKVVKKELTSTSNSSGGIIDIELIRKVIREELDSRPKTEITSNTAIKKELVDTVVEKIVEQSQEETNEIKDIIHKSKEVDTLTKIKLDTVVDTVVDTSGIIGIASVLSNAISTLDTKSDTIKPDTTKPDTTKPDIEIDIDITKEPRALFTSKIKSKVLQNLDESKKTVKTVKPQKSKGSLEQLLDDTVSADDEDNIEIDNLITTTIDDSKINKSNTNTEKKTNNISNLDKTSIAPKNKNNELIFSNIDDINLNLDLDFQDETPSEVDLDELQMGELQSSVVEKDKNTKFIFFDDAK